MSNRKNKKNRSLLIPAIAAVVVIAVAALLLLNNNANCCAADTIQSLSPAAYQEDFISSGSPHLLVDVRTPEEFATGHIAGALNIPPDSLPTRLAEIPSDQPVVVYCRSGNRSAQASQLLAAAGYTGIYDLGGIITWTAQGFPVQ